MLLLSSNLLSCELAAPVDRKTRAKNGVVRHAQTSAKLLKRRSCRGKAASCSFYERQQAFPFALRSARQAAGCAPITR